MKYRKLRIAWSMGWGLFAVLPIVLWARSFYICDYFTRRGTPVFISESSNSTVVTTTVAFNSGMVQVLEALDPVGPPHGWQYGRRAATDSVTMTRLIMVPNAGGGTSHSILSVVLLTAGLAAAAWLPWRFSLRTLLIATTLIAVLLGLIVLLSQ